MEQELVARFDAKRDEIRGNLLNLLINSDYCIDYIDIVKVVIEAVHYGYGTPDPERIHEIDDGDYQGTLLYVIPDDCYQPYNYWCAKVAYGSCGVCDTLQAILEGEYGHTVDEVVDALFTLALHIVQGLKKDLISSEARLVLNHGTVRFCGRWITSLALSPHIERAHFGMWREPA